jgi:CDP-glucose 4,6-dehydratase
MPEKFWQNRNVFVTGCTGLLGSWLTAELVQRGASVTGLVRDLVPRAKLNWSGVVNRINVVRGEVEDYALLERALNEYEVETVFHLAAQTIVGTANRNPNSTFATNIQGTWNLLEACRRNPMTKQIVVASSDKAYGAQPKLPYDETTPLEGRHPYDVSKSCVDLIAQSYFKTFRLPVCVTRCGNFYGGGDLNFNRIVPGTIRSVLFNERPVIRSDGTLIRDYFYIEDAVGAYLMLAEKMAELDVSGEAFNFSNEIQVTVLDLAQKVLKLMKSNLEPVIQNQAQNEIPHQYLSARKAREKLGWKPLFTLEQGLKRTVEWYREFFAKA